MNTDAPTDSGHMVQGKLYNQDNLSTYYTETSVSEVSRNENKDARRRS